MFRRALVDDCFGSLPREYGVVQLAAGVVDASDPCPWPGLVGRLCRRVLPEQERVGPDGRSLAARDDVDGCYANERYDRSLSAMAAEERQRADQHQEEAD